MTVKQIEELKRQVTALNKEFQEARLNSDISDPRVEELRKKLLDRQNVLKTFQQAAKNAFPAKRKYLGIY